VYVHVGALYFSQRKGQLREGAGGDLDKFLVKILRPQNFAKRHLDFIQNSKCEENVQ